MKEAGNIYSERNERIKRKENSKEIMSMMEIRKEKGK